MVFPRWFVGSLARWLSRFPARLFETTGSLAERLMNPLSFLAMGFGHARISKKRKLVALLIAGCADLLQGVLLPLVIEGGFSPVEWAVDIATAVALLLTVGFKARLALAFTTELIPGLDLFPTWVALVLTLPVEEAVPPARSPSGAIEPEVLPPEGREPKGPSKTEPTSPGTQEPT